MKTLSNENDRREISLRLADLSATDRARWGLMSVHQMVRHLDDSYEVACGRRTVSPATGFMQGTVIKWFALSAPMRWPKGVPTRPEIEQGKGGSIPGNFLQDLASLLAAFGRFCDDSPRPLVPHPIFGKMTAANWMRWGYLHTDHHLRQFGR
jgi:Protein of unknown function (DUF1569)